MLSRSSGVILPPGASILYKVHTSKQKLSFMIAKPWKVVDAQVLGMISQESSLEGVYGK